MKRQPYFDTLVGFSEGGENKTKDSITTEFKIDLKKKPSDKRSLEDGISSLLADNESHRVLTNENIELAHKIATMEIEHDNKLFKYSIITWFIGFVVGFLLETLIKLILG